MSWLPIIALAALVFALAVYLLKLPRALWMLFGSALLFGLAGYAMHGNPGQPGAPADPVVDGVLCVDDPKKELLGSDCTAYALHPGCDQDLHALYDGALYGKEYSGITVADLCPKACKVCT